MVVFDIWGGGGGPMNMLLSGPPLQGISRWGVLIRTVFTRSKVDYVVSEEAVIRFVNMHTTCKTLLIV